MFGSTSGSNINLRDRYDDSIPTYIVINKVELQEVAGETTSIITHCRLMFKCSSLSFVCEISSVEENGEKKLVVFIRKYNEHDRDFIDSKIYDLNKSYNVQEIKDL